jgi:hypothetical protein
MTQGLPANSTASLHRIVADIQADVPGGSDGFHDFFADGLCYLISRQLSCPDINRMIAEIEREVISVIQQHDGFSQERVVGLVRSSMNREIAEVRRFSRMKVSDCVDGALPTDEVDYDARQPTQTLADNAVVKLSKLPPHFCFFLWLRYYERPVTSGHLYIHGGLGC